MTSPTKRGKRLFGEPLEARELLAGDVSVQVFHGNLYITGDNASNYVLVDGTGTDGEFEITGLSDANAAPTSINHDPNGSTTVDGVTGSIFVDLRGGDDFFGLADATVHKNLSIDMGWGNDQTDIGLFAIPIGVTTVVSLPTVTPLQVPIIEPSVTVCGSVWVNLGPGDNSLFENSLLVKGSESIDGSWGDDDVTLTDAGPVPGGTSLGTGVTILHDLNLNLGGGSNELEVYDLDVDGSMRFKASGENFVELAIINIGCDATFNFWGGGNQHFILGPEPLLGVIVGTQNHIGGNLSVSTGWGCDVVEEASVAICGSNWISTDGGNDEVLIGAAHDNITPDVVPVDSNELEVTIGKNLWVDLGSGRDILNAFDVAIGWSMWVEQRGGSLSADLELLLVGNLLSLSSGGSGDAVNLDAVQADWLTVRLGPGDDSVTVTDSTITHWATFDGGPGTDTFNDGGGNSFGQLRLFRFEIQTSVI